VPKISSPPRELSLSNTVIPDVTVQPFSAKIPNSASPKSKNFNNVIMGIDLETRQQAEQNIIAKGITPDQAAFNSLVQQEYQKLKLKLLRERVKQNL